MTIQVSKITNTGSVPAIDKPIDKPPANFLLILMFLQSRTSDMAHNEQIDAAKRKKDGVFMQSLINELKSKNLTSPEELKAFVNQIKNSYGADKLGYDGELALKQLETAFNKLQSLVKKMKEVKKEIDELKKEVKELEKDKEKYQKEVDGYTRKIKRGGIVVPGYNAYLAAQIIKYRNKRDDAGKKITEKNGEIELKKMPELNALQAEAIRIRKGFEGSKESDAIQIVITEEDRLVQLKALLDAAMSSNLL